MSGIERHVLMLRHPQTVANAEGRFIGHCDSPRTPCGEAQVLEMARVVAEWQPDVIYSSPLTRARAAAREIAPPGVEVVVLDGLAEIDFGELQGLTWEEASERGILPDYSGKGPVAPGGENTADFAARVSAAGSVITSGPRRSAVVAHGGVARELCAEWLRIPLDAAWRIGMRHGSALGFKIGSGWAVLELLRPLEA